MKNLGKNKQKQRFALIALSFLAVFILTNACLDPVEGTDTGTNAPDAAAVDTLNLDAGSQSQDADLVRDAGSADISVGLQSQGQSNKLELATWNIQDFPKAGDETVNNVVGIIHDLQLDLIAVEEISDMRQFQMLTNRLPHYSGLLTTDHYTNGSYQKTGVIYRPDVIALSNAQELFDGEDFAFPRSPMQVDVVATAPGGGQYDFTLIIVHLKAGTESADYASRRQAIEALKTYVDDERVAHSGRDYVLLGDFNAKVFGASSDALEPMLNDNDYKFLTKSLAEHNEYSLPAYHIFIDQIVVTDEGSQDFANAQTQVLHLDEQVENYVDLVSDHRLVMTSITPTAW